jgi:hypothetical protein
MECPANLTGGQHISSREGVRCDTKTILELELELEAIRQRRVGTNCHYTLLKRATGKICYSIQQKLSHSG